MVERNLGSCKSFPYRLDSLFIAFGFGLQVFFLSISQIQHFVDDRIIYEDSVFLVL